MTTGDTAKDESKDEDQKERPSTPPTLRFLFPHHVEAFHEKLLKSKRILAVCGAGLSAPSGIPTYRGPGGLWTDEKLADLATPEAFAEDPGVSWLFHTLVGVLSLRGFYSVLWICG